MPILQREPDLYPENLFELAAAACAGSRLEPQEAPILPEQQASPRAADRSEVADTALSVDQVGSQHTWWVLYCLAQKEKKLMRWLRARKIGFYCPLYEKRWRAGGGRLRKSYLPLFSSYVFLYGDEADRYTALTSGCVSRCLAVPAPEQLTADLQRICQAIRSGRPLVPEKELVAGRRVRVRSGHLSGIEGVILRREGQTRLLVAVDFIQQGASLEVDECELELIDDDWHTRHGLRPADTQGKSPKLRRQRGARPRTVGSRRPR